MLKNPERSFRSRHSFGMLATLLLALSIRGAPSFAQEASPAPDPMSESAPGQATETPTPATPAATAQPPPPEPPKKESFAHWMLRSSGPIGYVLLLMSFVSLGLAIQFVLELRRSKVMPAQLV